MMLEPGTCERTKMCGTPIYMSPQILNKESYSHKLDVWAIGIIFYELLIGTVPFLSKNIGTLKEKIINGIYYIPFEANLSIECISLLA